MSRLLAVATALVLGVALAPLASTAAQAAACTGTVQVAAITFNPAQGTPGQIDTATVTVQNCTAQPQTVSILTTARFLGATTGIPAGCPAIDPLPPAQPTIPAGGTWSGSTGYLLFASCTATSLEITARVTDQTGALLDTRTADLPIASAPPPCAVAYRVTGQTRRSFAAQVTITDTGATAITGWTLVFRYTAGQHVTSARDATVTQAADTVTAAAKSYNATIAPGASVTFSLQATYSSTNPAPTAFALNGTPCQVR